MRFELTTSSMPWKRAPNCATGPREAEPLQYNACVSGHQSRPDPSLAGPGGNVRERPGVPSEECPSTTAESPCRYDGKSRLGGIVRRIGLPTIANNCKSIAIIVRRPPFSTALHGELAVSGEIVNFHGAPVNCGKSPRGSHDGCARSRLLAGVISWGA